MLTKRHAPITSRFPLMITIGLLLSICGATYCQAAANGRKIVTTIELTTTRHRHMTATVEFDKTGPASFGEFIVVFNQSSPNGKSIEVDAGAGLLDNVHIEAHDFGLCGRKQLFVSCEMQAMNVHIYDYDGKQVKTIYTPDGGRVHVAVRRNRNGDWELVERWANYHFDSFEDMGTGFRTGPHEVTRIMTWRHGKFLLKYPGPTTIVVPHCKI